MREQLLDFLKRELIGPDPIPHLVQGNGEEIIKEPPRLRYGAGILFPQAALADNAEANDETEAATIDQAATEIEAAEGSDLSTDDRGGLPTNTDDSLDTNDETLTLANAFLPSAMGFSCFLDIPETGLVVNITAGRYEAGEVHEEDREGNPIFRKAYFRESLDTAITIPAADIPTRPGQSRNFAVEKEGQPTGLVLSIRNRTTGGKFGTDNQLCTFSLINRRETEGIIRNEDCFFQVSFSVRAQNGSACFRPYPVKKVVLATEDEQSNRLLYRIRCSFAVGHGCAPAWPEATDGQATEIRADVIPAFEMKPILPRRLPDVSLKMYDLSDYGDPNSLTTNLVKLCDLYETWIDDQARIAGNELSGQLAQTAGRHIENCRRCLTRMREGIDLLDTDPAVRRAFTLMNRAMLLQQLHYNLPLRKWQARGKGNPTLEESGQPDSDIHRPETWPRLGLGAWYPFQIAFILMNLKSMARPQSDDRKIVDLIWFPTGGGKTEAYLGLTAFTIFLKRLRDKADVGATILMRYTLRLLTAQQYQRAASLICACDAIRRDNEAELGTGRITIGLWVGRSLTPNRHADAVKAFDRMAQDKGRENPFVILQCPWCGAQMGAVKVNGSIRMRGYQKKRRPSRVVLQCHNSECDFSADDYPLPLQVVDEDIYDSPPTLLIGTVDKFALLPWFPQAAAIFGFREDRARVSPPELIIQDELHLISGPLGSMVGHYETLIGELCQDRTTDPPIGAKIIASTATISRAKEQGHALYNCGPDNVFQFPPQCLEAGESFFAYEDRAAPGRMYVGVHASGLPSHATTQVRVIAALLQGAKSATVVSERERNPYWTIVSYFNSLRELGHAATLIRADIREHLNAVWSRKGIKKAGGKDLRRFVNRDIELTSRVSSSEVPEYLQALGLDYPDHDYPVDICLATNMISVGVDVPRLGLMAVIGQPKTTAEYIQATSRVGRSKEGPGLVVVIYNTGKPRDRSHYEHFYSYHNTIYGQVEPTSVTPFSIPVRERALHALLVTLVRYYGDRINRESPQPYPDDTLLDRIEAIVANRVRGVDPDELHRTLKLLEEKLEEWKNHLPPKYGGFGSLAGDTPLMHPAGSTLPEDWEERVWPTPTSMRNVDASCEAKVIGSYVNPDGEED